MIYPFPFRFPGFISVLLSLSIFFSHPLLRAQDTLNHTPDTLVEEEERPDTQQNLEFVPDATGFSLASPYHTIFSHLHFLQEESYHPDSAALTFFVGKDQQEEAIKVAIQLKKFMDGSGYFIDLDEIPRENDYLDTISGVYKYFPISTIPEIYLYRQKGKWFYSRRTFNAVPGLYKGLYPFGTLDWLPEWSKTLLLGLKLWQWAGVLLIFILILVFINGGSKLLGSLLRRLSAYFIKGDFEPTLFVKLARPISLLLLTLLLIFLTPMLQLPPVTNKYFLLVLRIMAPVFGVVIVYYLVDLLKAYLLNKARKTASTMDDQIIPLLTRVIKGLVIVFGVLIILGHLKVNITALLAGISIGGLAVALAAQDTVKNFLGSIMIFVDRPFQIGDWIDTGTWSGEVEEVGIRSTRIRTFDNSLLAIPNGTLADNAINNFGLRKFRRFVTRFGLTYDTSPEKIEEFAEGLRKIILAHPLTRKEAFNVNFNEMGDSALILIFSVFLEVGNWGDELKVKHDLLLEVLTLAEKLGVSFAFPTQTLHVESLPAKPKES